MSKIISEKDDNLIVSMTKMEMAHYCQSTMESFANHYENDEVANSVLLSILIALGPVIKYALPNTQALYNEWFEELNSAEVESEEIPELEEKMRPELNP